MSSIKDSFSSSTEEPYETGPSTVRNFDLVDASFLSLGAGRKRKPSLEQGCILWDSARWHRALPLLSCKQFLTQAYSGLCKAFADFEDRWRVEIGVSMEGPENQSLDSAGWSYSTPFRHLENSHCYISIHSALFKLSFTLWLEMSLIASILNPHGWKTILDFLIAHRCAL